MFTYVYFLIREYSISVHLNDLGRILLHPSMFKPTLKLNRKFNMHTEY